MGLRPTKVDEDAEWKNRLAGESAYPTLRLKRGAGAFACQLFEDVCPCRGSAS
jgi:hypothetical protein